MYGRRIIATLLLLMNVGISLSQNDTVIHYPNNKYWYKGSIIEKKMVGTWEMFDNTNKKVNILEFLDNNRCKIIPISRDTLIQEIYHGYIQGDTIVLHGEFNSFHISTNSKIEGFYFNGKKTGTWVQYKNDKPILIESFNRNSDNKLWVSIEQTGNINYVSYLNKSGVLNGLYIDFDELNRIKQTGNYDNGLKIGEWLYYKNGKLESRGSYYSDYLQLKELKLGVLTIVNKDSIPADQIYSKEVIKMFNYSKAIFYLKEGKWEYYTEEGKLERIEFYKKGELTKTKRPLFRK